VWHLHETLDWLDYLVHTYPRIALGSSGEYVVAKSRMWWERMHEVMGVVCANGIPICKLHGLRMLDPEICSVFPLSSADSQNISMNIGIDKAWTGSYQPPDKDWRALVMAARIESTLTPTTYTLKLPVSNRLF
jgi:hypothetical protein